MSESTTHIAALLAHLDERIFSRANDEATLQTQLQECKAPIIATSNELREIKAWIEYHKTSDDDVTIGFKQHEYTRSLVSLARSFRFDITTDFPIRRIDDSKIPTTSKWDTKDRPFQEGGTRFVAVLRNKRNASALASVELFGRRNEVYAEELKQHRTRQEELKTLSITQNERVKKKALELDRFHEAADQYVNHRNSAAMDLSWLDGVGRAYDTDNAYIICDKLGLKSQIWKTYVISPDVHEKLNASYAVQFMESQQTAQSEMVQYLESLSLKLHSQKQADKMHSQAIARHMRELGILTNRQSLHDTEITASLVQSRDSGSVTKPQIEILKAALKLLESDAGEVQTTLRKAVESLENTRQSRVESTVNDEVKSQLKLAQGESWANWWATNKILTFLSPQEKSWPIAVYACFGEDISVEDSWLQVWKGARACYVRE